MIPSPDEVGSEDVHQQFIQNLRQKFFPRAIRPPPAFFPEIFDLVANTCSVPTCKMDNVIDLLERVFVAYRISTVSDDDDSIPPSESVSDGHNIREEVIRYQALPRRYQQSM